MLAADIFDAFAAALAMSPRYACHCHYILLPIYFVTRYAISLERAPRHAAIDIFSLMPLSAADYALIS